MVATASLTWADLSASTQAAFQFAAGLAGDDKTGQSSAIPPVSARMLLIGIVDAHPDPASSNRNPLLDLLMHFSLDLADLNAEIDAKWKARPPSPPLNATRHRRRTLVDLPPLRGHAPAVLQEASRLMDGVRRRPARLPLRFLFGGMLRVPESGAYRTIDTLLSDRTNLSAIAEAYQEFLDLPGDPRFADFLADRFPSSAPFAGTVADNLVGQDLLGRGKLIGDLARWLAVRNLQTPLAIGLFGDWGSGKSFFMARLGEEITRVAKRARVRPDSAFCSHIVQVNFNAWLYSDSDIWPSLASQVFRAVRSIPDTGPFDASIKELDEYLQQQSPGFADARIKTDEAQHRVSEAVENVGRLDQEIRASHDRLVDCIGELGPDAQRAAENGRSVAAAVSSGKLAIESIRRLRPAAKVGLLLLALLAAAGSLLTALNPTVLAATWAVLGIIGTSAAVIARLLTTARSAIDEYRTQVVLQEQRVAAAKSLADAELARQRAQAALASLPRLSLIDAYASEQATVWKARERLGAVTEIRHAFEMLSKIISTAHKKPKPPVGQQSAAAETARDDENAPTPASDDAAAPPIDRIVVYIDDLDRCRPEQVIEVLEAVKLLMDLEHFVVIVGVDSRWLFRSLEIRFRELLSTDGADTDGGWAATPQNYLEKIFQFSLMLPRINKEGYERLVLELLRTDRSGAEEGEFERTDTNIADESVRHGEGSPNVGEQVVPDIESPSQKVEDTPGDLLLRDEELAMIRALAMLIQTPRSAKRLTNIYRLMRVTYGEERLLKDDSYVVVLLLLGIIVGYPRQGTAVLTAMDQAPPPTEWDIFVRSLKPEQTVDHAVPRTYSSEIRQSMSESEATEWAQLSDDLRRITDQEKWSLRVSEFVSWLPRVAEYTFHPWRRSALLSGEASAAGPAPANSDDVA